MSSDYAKENKETVLVGNTCFMERLAASYMFLDQLEKGLL
jgi:hypothetical protein